MLSAHPPAGRVQLLAHKNYEMVRLPQLYEQCVVFFLGEFVRDQAHTSGLTNSNRVCYNNGRGIQLVWSWTFI